jgi:hypothetical protein
MADPKYDVREAERILGRVADAADVREVVEARTAAARDLLEGLVGLDGKSGVHVARQNESAIHVHVGNRSVFVLQESGKIRIAPELPRTPGGSAEGHEVPLTFDPVDTLLLGPKYDESDSTTGERKTKHRDALITVAEAIAKVLLFRGGPL